MPRSVAQVRIFLASPAELDPEHEVIRRVVAELNITWIDQFGVSFDLLHWRTHSHPAIASDPQAAINIQIPQDYDIFIGLFWTTLGTRTPRAPSGTVEELERAVSRWNEDPTSVRIMVYFKDAPVSPTSLDGEELAALQAFRRSLTDRGIFYATFATSDDIAQLQRLHLTKQAQDVVALAPPPTTPPPGTVPATQPPSDALEVLLEDDGEGFLDLIQRSVSSSQRASQVMAHLTEEMTALTPKLKRATAETHAVSPTDSGRLSKYMSISNRVARALDAFAATMAPEIPILEEAITTSIEAQSKAVSMLPQFGSSEDNVQQVRDSLDALSHLRDAMLGSSKSMTVLRDSAQAIPRTTTQFGKARRRYVDVLEAYLSTTDHALRLIPQFEASAVTVLNSLQTKRDHQGGSPAA